MLAGTGLPHTLRHGLLVHLGIWFLTAFAVSVHVTYRVPSWLIVTWLPWVGLVLLVLGLLMLINHVLTNPTGRTAVLTPAERWSMVSSLALLLATLVAPGGVLGEMLTLLLWVALATIVVTLLVMATRLAAPALGPLARKATVEADEVRADFLFRQAVRTLTGGEDPDAPTIDELFVFSEKNPRFAAALQGELCWESAPCSFA